MGQVEKRQRVQILFGLGLWTSAWLQRHTQGLKTTLSKLSTVRMRKSYSGTSSPTQHVWLVVLIKATLVQVTGEIALLLFYFYCLHWLWDCSFATRKLHRTDCVFKACTAGLKSSLCSVNIKKKNLPLLISPKAQKSETRRGAAAGNDHRR